MAKAKNCAQHPVETPQVKEFYSAIFRPEGPIFELIPSAKPVEVPNYPEFEFFLYNEVKHFENQPFYFQKHPKGKWTLVEAKTGQALGHGTTQVKAVQNTLELLTRVEISGRSIASQIAIVAEQVGLSPRYDALSAVVE